MDAQEYDRIADLLMQIRKKYDNLVPTTNTGHRQKTECLAFVHDLIELNHTLAEIDGKGWL